MKFIEKWVELKKNITSSKISQTQEDKWYMFYLLCGAYL